MVIKASPWKSITTILALTVELLTTAELNFFSLVSHENSKWGCFKWEVCDLSDQRAIDDDDETV